MQYINSEGLLIDTIKNESRICGITNILSGNAVALLGNSNTVGASSLTFMGNNNTVSSNSVLFGGEYNVVNDSFLINGSFNSLSADSILLGGTGNTLISNSLAINGLNNYITHNGVAINTANSKLSSDSISFFDTNNTAQNKTLSFYNNNSQLSSSLALYGNSNIVKNSINIQGSNNTLNSDVLNVLSDNSVVSTSSVNILGQTNNLSQQGVAILSENTTSKNNGVAINTYNSFVDDRACAVLEDESIIQSNSIGLGGNNNVLRLSSLSINNFNSRLTDKSFAAFTTNSTISSGSISIGKSNNVDLRINSLGIYNNNSTISSNSISIGNTNSVLRDNSLGISSNNAKISSGSVELLGTNNVVGISSIDILGQGNLISNKSFSVIDFKTNTTNSVSIKNNNSNFTSNSIGIAGSAVNVSNSSVVLAGSAINASNTSVGVAGLNNTVLNSSVILAGSAVNASNTSVGLVGSANTVSNSSVVLAGSVVNASNSSIGIAGLNNTVSNSSVVLAGSAVNASNSSVVLNSTNSTATLSSLIISGQNNTINNNSMGLGSNNARLTRSRSLAVGGDDINFNASNSLAVGGQNILGSGLLFNPNVSGNNITSIGGINNTLGNNTISIGGKNNILENNSVFIGGSGNSVGPFNNITMINVNDVQAAENNTAYLPRSFFTGNVTVKGNVSASGNITSIDTLITTEWVARLVNYLQTSAVLYLDQRNTLGNYNVAEFNYLGSPKMFVTRQGVGINTSSVPAPYVLTFNGSASGTSLALNDTLTFGSNSDTNLYRGGANKLATDDDLIVAGNVGIGTTSPSTKLEISNISTGVNPTWQGGTDFLKLFANNSNFSEQAISFQETGTNVGAKIGVKNTGNGAYDIIFANRDTSSFASALTEKLRISNTGNVGIGTSSPIDTLHVEGAIYITPKTSKFNPGGPVDANNLTETYLTLGPGSSTNDWAYIRQIGGANNYNLSIDLHDDGDSIPGGQAFSIRCIGSSASNPDPAPLTRFHIDNIGNVGIGTASPQGRLHVHGGPTNDQAAELYISGSNGWTMVHNSSTGGSWNPLVAAGDKSIIFSDGSVETGNLVIAPWSNGSKGLKINKDGVVLIGTSAPSSSGWNNQKLEVFGGSLMTRVDSPEGGRLELINATKTGAEVSNWSLYNMTGQYSKGLHFWRYQANGGNPGTALFLADNGNVGIGNTTPSEKLDVSGICRVDYLVVDAQDSLNEGGEISLRGSGSYGNLQLDNFTGNLRLHTLEASNFFEIIGGSSTLPALRIVTGGAVINGKVGIGTTSPSQKLHVVADSDANGTALFAAPGANASIKIDAMTTGHYAYQTFSHGGTGRFELGIDPDSNFYINRNVQFGFNGASIYIQKSSGFIGVATTNPKGHLNIGLQTGNNANNYNTYNSDSGRDGLLINAYDLGQPNTWRRVCDIVAGGGNTGSEIRFLTSNYWSYTATQKMIISHDGLVGIGSAYPSVKLDVNDNVNSNLYILSRNINNGNAAHAGIAIGNDTNWNKFIIFTNSSTRTNDGGAGNTTMRTDSGKLLLGAGGVTYHALDTNGFVGIGTTNPQYRLHVSGTVFGDHRGIAYGGPGTSYASAFQIREADIAGNSNTGDAYRPRLGFHWGNVVASSISLRQDGAFSFDNDPGTDRQDVHAGWFRSHGTLGWYSQTYGGGWYMSDTTWIRSYGEKNVWLGSGLLGANGGLTVGWGGVSPATNGAIIKGNVGLGGSVAYTPWATLHIRQNDAGVNSRMMISSNQDVQLMYSTDREGIVGWSFGQDATDGNKFKIGNYFDTLQYNTRLTIDNAGRVGIGTAAPWSNSILDVAGSVMRVGIGNAYNAASNTGNNGYGYIQFGSSSASGPNGIPKNWHLGTETDNSFRLFQGNWGSGTERIKVDSSGRATFWSGDGNASNPTVAVYSGGYMGMYGSGGALRFGVNGTETCRMQNDGAVVAGYFYSNGRYYAAGSGGAIGVNDGGWGSIFEQQSVSAGDPNYADGHAAYMTFHRPGRFAVKFGLDTDNKLKVGGWSMDNNAYEIWHDGNVGVKGDGRYVKKAGDTLTGRLGQSVSGFHSANVENIGSRINSGFYENNNARTNFGWPTTTNTWYHLLASTHSNDANYYSMQFAGSFFDSNEIYYRATNGSGYTKWNKIYHEGNLVAGVKFASFRQDRALYTQQTCYRMNTFLGVDGEIYIAGQSSHDLGMGLGVTTFTGGYRLLTRPWQWQPKMDKYWVAPETIYYKDVNGGLWGIGRTDIYQLGINYVPATHVYITGGVSEFATSTDISGGYTSQYVITTWGELYAWGYNGQGQLGKTASGTIQQTPEKVTLPAGIVPSKIFAFGDNHTTYGRAVLLDTQGRVYVAGNNGYGQLGTGNSTNVSSFTQVNIPDNDPIVYACGTSYNTAGAIFLLSSSGRVYSSGYGGYNQHGAGNTNDRNTFTRINVDNKVISAITVSGHYANNVFAVATDGTAYCWGYNYSGSFGFNNNNQVTTPKRMGHWNDNNSFIEFNNVKKVVTAGRALALTAVLLTDGNVYAAGYNGYGALGRRYVSPYYLVYGTFGVGDNGMHSLMSSHNFVDIDIWGGDGGGGVGLVGVTNEGILYSTGYGGGGSVATVQETNNNAVWRKAHIQ